MGSETALKLPVIDFTKPGLKSGTNEWDLAKEQVQQALQEYGCFDALFDKVPLELQEAMFEAMEELFNRPSEIKSGCVNCKRPFLGYLANPCLPLYEGMGFDNANDFEKVDARIRMLWPQGNTNLSKMIESYSKQLSELDQIIRRMILESFHLEKYMDEHMNSTKYLLRMMKYKAPETTETKLGLNGHRDKNIVTILNPNEVKGLEVQTKDGEWIHVEPSSKDSFIVMIGESLYALLNGRISVPYHRVLMTGDKTRYSISHISAPKEGYIIKAPAELVDEGHPLLFKPFDPVDFTDFYCCSEAGRKAEFALKEFLGVQALK